VKPVYGFVEADAAQPLEVTRSAGAPKEDKLVIQFAEASKEASLKDSGVDAQAYFKTATLLGEVTIPLKAE